MIPAITWEDFSKIDLRIGEVVDAQPFPEARRPAYILHVDFGPLGIKKTSAQITDHYTTEGLLGKKVVAIVNFPPKQIGPHKSEVLILGGLSDSGVVLLQPDQIVKNGTKIG